MIIPTGMVGAMMVPVVKATMCSTHNQPFKDVYFDARLALGLNYFPD